jgi:hypothetical protein
MLNNILKYFTGVNYGRIPYYPENNVLEEGTTRPPYYPTQRPPYYTSTNKPGIFYH